MQNKLSLDLKANELIIFSSSLVLFEQILRANQGYLETMLFRSSNTAPWIWRVEEIEKQLLKIESLKEKLKMEQLEFNQIDLQYLKESLESQIEILNKAIADSDNLENDSISEYFKNKKQPMEQLLKKIMKGKGYE